MEIVFKPSPNFIAGRKGYRPIAIVIHIMQGTLSGTDSWFASTRSQVSAHYGIGAEGDIHRYVLETNTAWHAGRVNAATWKLLMTGGNGYIINPNYYTIGIEHEGTEDTVWTDTMYDTSSSLIADIAQRWDIPLDRDHVIGHHEIYSLKTCPGNKVDINKLITLATAKKNITPVVPGYATTSQAGKVKTVCPVNIRQTPDRTLEPVGRVEEGVTLNYIGFTPDGENVAGCSKWYLNAANNWFWSGAVMLS